MGLISYIQGQNIEHIYSVEYKRNDKDGKLTEKPRLNITNKIKYENLKRADNHKNLIVYGEIGRNKKNDLLSLYTHVINVSEEESVTVLEEIFRADLNAYIVHTNKIVSEKDIFKEESTEFFNKLISEYNEMKISEDKELSTYCKVHKLIPSDTDYDELVSIVKKPTPITTLSTDDYYFTTTNKASISITNTSGNIIAKY